MGKKKNKKSKEESEESEEQKPHVKVENKIENCEGGKQEKTETDEVDIKGGKSQFSYGKESTNVGE